jgi:hypothetical protein
MYKANPKRGCGTKKKGGFYLEGGELDEGGTLWTATYFFGSGLLVDMDSIRGVNIQVPPRQMNIHNIPGTIANAQLEPATSKFVPVDTANWTVYQNLKGKRVKRLGIIDHVGSSYYTPWTFSEETRMLGPSRRTTEEFAFTVAALIQRYGPIPVLFTHSEIPVFETAVDREDALTTLMMEPSRKMLEPTWLWEDFGMYAGMDPGNTHYMRHILRAMDSGETFDNVMTIEQPFVASWYTRVTYTLPEDGRINDKIQNMYDAGLINIIDLDQIEEAEEEEVMNE